MQFQGKARGLDSACLIRHRSSKSYISGLSRNWYIVLMISCDGLQETSWGKRVWMRKHGRTSQVNRNNSGKKTTTESQDSRKQNWAVYTNAVFPRIFDAFCCHDIALHIDTISRATGVGLRTLNVNGSPHSWQTFITLAYLLDFSFPALLLSETCNSYLIQETKVIKYNSIYTIVVILSIMPFRWQLQTKYILRILVIKKPIKILTSTLRGSQDPKRNSWT